MIALDTSVAIAAFASWHEAHTLAADVLAERPRLPAPVALETYAVLTRMTPPHRAEAPMVHEFLERSFPDDQLVLPASRLAHVVEELARMGIVGGASYDAVIAMTAAHHGCQLVTMDSRARATYDRVGVAARLLG